MRKALSILSAVLFGAASVGAAHACSCARNPNADDIFATHAAIFTGLVRAVETIAPGQSMTTFVVTEPFKGVRRGETVNVHHRSAPTAACGVTFEYGKGYTVAASREPSGLSTSQCSTWMFLPHVGLSGELISRLRSLRARR
jgi:hypothetical protein